MLEGIGIGEERSARRDILGLVEAVFGYVPESLPVLLNEIKDVARLHTLVTRVVGAKTLDEFMGLVKISLQ